MPKLLALRWPIGIGVGLLLTAAVWLSSGSSSGSRGTSPLSAIAAFFTGDEYSSELRELGSARVADAFAAAVARDDPHDLALFVLELAESRSQLDHPLGKRAHLLEGAVSLVRSEAAVGHLRVNHP